jgi:hypothetical protein
MEQHIYKMELLNNSNSLLKNLDYFFLASGSDSRAYEILKKCNSLSNATILFHFNERVEDIQETDALYDYRNFNVNNLQEISCEIKNPESCYDEFIKINIPANSIIGIDISCFTKPYFYYIIKLLKERFSVSNIYIFYTEPKSYIFPEGLFNSFHTSSGPISVHEMFGYTGQERRNSKRKLIILLGFDGDLSKEINEDVSPHDTVIVNGFPSYTPKCKDVSLIANEKLVNDKQNIKIEYTRANNPFETYNLLQSIKKKDANAFINIAPLGPKPMALGACLFALHNPEVRIVYPLPENYEKKYTNQCWKSWVYDFPLID